MKAFKDLTINLSQGQHSGFIAEVEEALPSGWIRDNGAEERLNDLTSSGFSCFVCEERPGLQVAMVSLVKTRSGDGLYVSNIVPRDVSELTMDEYNLILDDFAKSCLLPVADGLGIKVEISEGEWDAKAELSEDSYRNLISFSRGANRATGTAHPLDRERWYNFVISVYKNGDDIDSSTLCRWMVEEDGWPEDMAYGVSGEFEQNLGLLQHFGR